jgi:hypothetical protein
MGRASSLLCLPLHLYLPIDFIAITLIRHDMVGGIEVEDRAPGIDVYISD